VQVRCVEADRAVLRELGVAESLQQVELSLTGVCDFHTSRGTHIFEIKCPMTAKGVQQSWITQVRDTTIVTV
jgi:hypothetical protein